MNNTKKLVLMAMFIALTFIGSYIKIPSPLQSIALDSTAAFLCALILGSFEGGMVAVLGHMLSAANSGFPLSLLIHIIVAVTMFISVFFFGVAYKKTNVYLAVIVGVILNGVASPLVIAVLPQFGWGFFIAMTPFLVLASFVNVIISALVYVPLSRTVLNNKGFDMLGK